MAEKKRARQIGSRKIKLKRKREKWNALTGYYGLSMKELLNAFVDTCTLIDELSEKREAAGEPPLYEATKTEIWINYKTFRMVLSQVTDTEVGTVDQREYLKLFRHFGFIRCNKDKFTAAREVNGKKIQLVVIKIDQMDLLEKMNQD